MAVLAVPGKATLFLGADMDRWAQRAERMPKPLLSIIVLLLTAFIGFFDYVTDTSVSLSAFYLLPVALAARFIGPVFALAIGALSVVLWLGGDIAVGRRFPDVFLVLWNGTVQFISYAVVVMLINNLRNLRGVLEDRVRQRAAALTREIAERERLERELLDVSEREQRRIGQDLHDGLCQHLAGTALAAQVVADKLSGNRAIDVRDATNVVELIEEGIQLARGMAKGLNPVEMNADGLMQSLQEFSGSASDMFRVSCRFECDSPVLIHDERAAEHLYRIAQEAVGNAIKHGRANNIAIQLSAVDEGYLLRIHDDGTGLPEPLPTNTGMGLRIMANRSHVIGAAFSARRDEEEGGTVVTCLMPFTTGSELVA
jgi:signal transduction histidine kinase